MSTSSDFVIGHVEHCDYCIGVEDRTDIDDVEKCQLQSEHAWESAIGAADSMVTEEDMRV